MQVAKVAWALVHELVQRRFFNTDSRGVSLVICQGGGMGSCKDAKGHPECGGVIEHEGLLAS